MVEITNLRKEFETETGDVQAVKGISFQVPEGNLLTLLGPSGCGKSTTLRCLAGLERPEPGYRGGFAAPRGCPGASTATSPSPGVDGLGAS